MRERERNWPSTCDIPAFLGPFFKHHKDVCVPPGRGVTVKLGVGLSARRVPVETRDLPLQYDIQPLRLYRLHVGTYAYCGVTR